MFTNFPISLFQFVLVPGEKNTQKIVPMKKNKLVKIKTIIFIFSSKFVLYFGNKRIIYKLVNIKIDNEKKIRQEKISLSK